jgi:hypothetical protein
MRVGFTGTRQGMSARQQSLLAQWLRCYRDEITLFEHGDCVGADEEAHAIACDILGSNIIAIRPPTNPVHRAWCKGGKIYPPEDYIFRNHRIVEDTECMIAAPSGPEKVRSGTWATIRYARKTRKPVYLLELV